MRLSDQWHTSPPYPQGNNPNAHWIGGCVGPGAGLYALENEINLLLLLRMISFADIHPIAQSLYKYSIIKNK